MKPSTSKLLAKFVGDAEKLVVEIRNDTIAALDTGDPITVIKHFSALRDQMDMIVLAKKALDEITEGLSRDQIPTLFTNKDLKTMTVEGVGRVTVSHRWSCSILDDPKSGKKPGYDWLRKNGHGDLITETVNSSSLAAFAKNMLQDDGVELPSKLFKTSTSPYTSITKA